MNIDQIIADVCAGAKAFFRACAYRPPECFIQPNEVDFDHFLLMVDRTGGWKMLMSPDCRPSHLEALWITVLEKHRIMKNTIFLTIVREQYVQDQNGIPVALDQVQWFRQKNFGCPPFQCEKVPTQAVISPEKVLEPLTVEEVLCLLNQQTVLNELMVGIHEDKKKVLRELLSEIEEKLKRTA